MNFAYYMANRLHSQSGRTSRASRLAVAIATAGVALGIMVMIIAICVVVGFKEEVRNKVTGLGCHLQVVNYESMLRPEYQPIQITDGLLDSMRAMPTIQHAQRFCTKGGMLKTDHGFQGILLKGVDSDYDLAPLKQYLQRGALPESFSADKSTNRIVISESLARQLNLGIGSKVYAYFFDKNLRARRFEIVATYSTHLSEYDSRLVYCDMAIVHQLLDFESDQVSGVELVANNFDVIDDAADEVYGLLNHRHDDYGHGYCVPTIRDLFSHFFSWLDLLDINVVVILLLMIAVAAFTTVSGLLIIILERTQFIGIMKALGASNGMLRHLFLYYVAFIIIRGVAVGNILGIGLCLLQQKFRFIALDAETYYVDAVPISMSWANIAIMNVIVLVVVLLVLVLPTHVVSRIHPARSIRFE